MLTKLWDMVNSAETLDQVKEAEIAIRESDVNNEDFDDLMMALSYISRECYHRL